MRVRGDAASRRQLLAEVVEALGVDAALQVGATVDAGRGVALEVDQVARVVLRAGAEEVVEADLVERRGRGIGRDVAADPVVDAVGLDDHRHRVPADEALDPPLDLAVAGIRRLLCDGDGVDVGRLETCPKTNARGLQPLEQTLDQRVSLAFLAVLEDGLEDQLEGLECSLVLCVLRDVFCVLQPLSAACGSLTRAGHHVPGPSSPAE